MDERGVYSLVGEMVKVSLEDLFTMPYVDEENVKENIEISRNRNDASYFFKESDLFLATQLDYDHLIEKYSKTNLADITTNYLKLTKAYDDLFIKHINDLEEIKKIKSTIDILSNILTFKFKKGELVISKKGKRKKEIILLKVKIEEEESKILINKFLIKKKPRSKE